MKKITYSNIISVAIVSLAFLLLSPSSDSLSDIKNVFWYGAGISVDSTSVVQGYATANNSYTDGFKFKMRVTVDSATENNLRLKFSDWARSGGSGTIPASSNMLVWFTSTPTVDAGTAYADPITFSTGSTGDLDLTAPGVQKDIYIWLKVPTSTTGGAYSTSYGVQSSSL